MGLNPQQRLRAKDPRQLTELPLSPEDFFVLSRLDGQLTVDQVVQTSGLGTKKTEGILARLMELGAVESMGQGQAPRESAAPRKRGKTLSGTGAKASARARKAKLLRAQFGGAKEKSRAEPKREPDAPEKKDAAPPPAEETVAVIDPVPADDTRLDRDLDIEIDEQRKLLAMQDRLEELSHFELLGIYPTDDVKLIRRAYHKRSRVLHPDKFYGKKIGAYKWLVQELFKRAKSSYDTLMDDTARMAYLERLLAVQRRQEVARAKREEQVQREREIEASIEREKQRRADEQAREERAKRDEARKRRSRARMSGINRRNDKVREMIEQGKAEMEAGRHGAAASVFRLALDADPDNTELQNMWQSSLAKARAQRASQAWESAIRYASTGAVAEAAHFFLEAADADPSPRNLAEAAAIHVTIDPVKAREFALAALDALSAAQAASPVDADVAGRVHLNCGRAFLAAEQTHTAREQAKLAKQLLPNSAEVRALLSEIKSV